MNDVKNVVANRVEVIWQPKCSAAFRRKKLSSFSAAQRLEFETPWPQS